MSNTWDLNHGLLRPPMDNIMKYIWDTFIYSEFPHNLFFFFLLFY
jgi:hypothetical protein